MLTAYTSAQLAHEEAELAEVVADLMRVVGSSPTVGEEVRPTKSPQNRPKKAKEISASEDGRLWSERASDARILATAAREEAILQARIEAARAEDSAPHGLLDP
jgi:hypothetical protein